MGTILAGAQHSNPLSVMAAARETTAKVQRSQTVVTTKRNHPAPKTRVDRRLRSRMIRDTTRMIRDAAVETYEMKEEAQRTRSKGKSNTSRCEWKLVLC
jgi:hypothetical protein